MLNLVWALEQVQSCTCRNDDSYGRAEKSKDILAHGPLATGQLMKYVFQFWTQLKASSGNGSGDRWQRRVCCVLLALFNLSKRNRSAGVEVEPSALFSILFVHNPTQALVLHEILWPIIYLYYIYLCMRFILYTSISVYLFSLQKPFVCSCCMGLKSTSQVPLNLASKMLEKLSDQVN